MGQVPNHWLYEGTPIELPRASGAFSQSPLKKSERKKGAVAIATAP
jgi:hypothetical protein